MSVVNISYGTLAALTVTLNSLASAGAVISSAVDNTTLLADDYLLELVIADISESGNKQVLIYVASSLDGTNYSDGSLTTMTRVGWLDVTGTGPHRMTARSLAAALGGVIPPKFKVAFYNDAGVSLAGSGNSASVLPIFYTAT